MLPAVVYRFGPFELRMPSRVLLRAGEPLAISSRQAAVLALLLSRAGGIVTKDEVMAAGWDGVLVGENSIEKMISELRLLCGEQPDGGPYVETLRRRGYRVTVPVSHDAVDGARVDALLGPYRQFSDGRAALQWVRVDLLPGAQAALEAAVRALPHYAPAHVGLANAYFLQFEATRGDAEPNRTALLLAIERSRAACDLDVDYAEAWATYGLALARAGRHADALAALLHATTIDPENPLHWVRLAAVASGRQRLDAARRALRKRPGFPFAHLLAATVPVALQTFADAEREVRAGIAGFEAQMAAGVPLSGVALHWLHGLLRLVTGDPAGAEAALRCELSFEANQHIYARESAGLSWHAIGALRLHAGDPASAVPAFEAALMRLPAYSPAHAGLRIAKYRLSGDGSLLDVSTLPAHGAPIDVAMARAALLREAGEPAKAAALVADALERPDIGSAGWVLPVEPLLNAMQDRALWAVALTRLAGRMV